ncbi:MAG TPA: MaoC family dehydratase N-terminal domain-containing protein [Chloroflexota bacterium]
MSSSAVGLQGAPWRFPVEWTKVWEFARSVAEDHVGDQMPVPPTFPAYGLCAFETMYGSAAARLDMHRVLHAEEHYRYLRPLRIGDRLRCQTRVVEDYRKQGRRGGTMRFIVTETEMRDEQTDALVVVTRTTMVQLHAGDDHADEVEA